MLSVCEIYRAILGESLDAGYPCVIVRLAGCHQRCVYCDTPFAFAEGEPRTIASVLAEVAAQGCRTVLVTGGEPLLQRGVLPLLAALVADGRRVVLETSGTTGARVALAEIPPGVRRVVDVKTPGSGILERAIDWEGLRTLGAADEIKLVCTGRDDYEWARDAVLADGRLPPGVCVTLSAAGGRLAPRELAEWILADGLEVRFQLQLHRVLWPERERGT
jgi:7-carboxy-7-deazaguanine synthase